MLGTINGNPGGLIGLVHGKPHKNGWRNHSNWQLDEVNKIESTSTSLDIHVFFWKARGSSISGSALRGQQSRKHF